MRISNKTLVLLLGSCILMQSCTKDADYDALTESNGIDFTLRVAKGLSLPFGSTDKIYLTEILDTAEVKQLTTDADGLFYLSQGGSFSPVEYQVNPFIIDYEPSIENDTVGFTLNSLPLQVSDVLEQLQKSGIDVSKYIGFSIAQISPSLENVTFSTDATSVYFDRNAECNISVTGVDQGLVDASLIGVNATAKLLVSLDLQNLPDRNHSYTIQVKDLKISLPEYLQLFDKDGNKVDPSDLHPNLEVVKSPGSTNAIAEITYFLSGMDFGKNPLVNNGGAINRLGSVYVTGYLSADSFSIASEDLFLDFEDGQYVAKVLKPAIVEPKVDPLHLAINEVTGHFNPSITKTSTGFDLDLSEEMDFLKGDDVVIDLKSPIISLDINNTSEIGIMADLSLAGSNNRVVKFNAIDCSQPGVRLTPADAASGCSFNTFLSPIPDHVDADVSPYVNPSNEYTFQLGKAFSVSGDYSFSIPFTFNALSFCYDKKIENIWGSSREDVVKKMPSLENALLNLEVENAIPMDLKLEIIGTNYNTGKEDANVVSCVVDKTIQKGTLASPTSTSLVVKLLIPDTGNLGDLILRISGEGKDCDFNSKEYLRIVSSNIVLSEGVNVDLN